MTLHRRENLPYLNDILQDVSNEYKKVYFYIHPHTKRYIKKVPKNIVLKKPVEYNKMMKLLSKAVLVITDSGGLVREAHWAGVRCKYIGENPWEDMYIFGRGDAKEKIKGIINEH
jgi:UDP-N-acetylglucosamine 2-epimerase